MSEHIYKYTHDSFNPNKAGNYNLLIRADTQTFSYAITENKTLMAWADDCPLNGLKSPGEFSDLLTADYRHIIIGLASTGFTLLPAGLFDEQLTTGFARLLDVKDNEKVYTCRLDLENYLLYKSDTELTPLITDNDEAAVAYRSAGWINAVAEHHPLNTELYLDINNGSVSVLNYSENKTRFYNTFSFKTPEDLAYFCALVTTELGLVAAETTLILSGEIDTTDNNFIYLAEFFKAVKLNTIKVLELPDAIKPHQILNLAALSLCASSAVS